MIAVQRAMRTTVALLLALVLSLLLACNLPSSGGNGCSKDSDCKGARVCVNGACADPASATAAAAPTSTGGCSTSADCPGTLECVGGKCQPRAAPAPTHAVATTFACGHTRCAKGQVCCADKKCISGNTIDDACPTLSEQKQCDPATNEPCAGKCIQAKIGGGPLTITWECQ